jgi:hemin uptake protein HemP
MNLPVNPHPDAPAAALVSRDAPVSLSISIPIPAVTERLSSTALLRGRREIEIDHEGAVYRLRVTALGKLILTK